MRLALLTSVLLSLSGCGTVYHTTTVRESQSANVRVVALTPETVLEANRSTYDPQQLPQAFSLLASAAGQSPGSGSLPAAIHDPEIRPAAIEARLPETLQPQPYRIGVGDVVLLSTPQSDGGLTAFAGLRAAENQRQGYTVQDDGAIAIPGVGRIAIGGLDLEEAEDAVFQALIDAQMNPTFSLEVREFNSQRVSIGGAVATAGMIPITLHPVYLDQAISLAGGVTLEDTEFGFVHLYRNGSLYQIPLSELYTSNGLRRILLIDGDNVFVDTAYSLDRAEAYFREQIELRSLRRDARNQAIQDMQQEISIRRAALNESRGNFQTRLELGAVDRDYVYIIGEVGTQARFALPFENTAVLADALLENGGIASGTGSPAHIYVLRASPGSQDFASVTALHLDATNAVNFILATQLELRPSDVVFVAEQPVTSWNRALQQVLPTFTLGRSLASG